MGDTVRWDSDLQQKHENDSLLAADTNGLSAQKKTTVSQMCSEEWTLHGNYNITRTYSEEVVKRKDIQIASVLDVKKFEYVLQGCRLLPVLQCQDKVQVCLVILKAKSKHIIQLWTVNAQQCIIC